MNLRFENVRMLGNLTDIQVRQFRIADNRLGELREWDPAALREEFEEIVLLDEDVNIEAMGVGPV